MLVNIPLIFIIATIVIWLSVSGLLYFVLRYIPGIRNWRRWMRLVLAGMVGFVSLSLYEFASRYCPVEITEMELKPLMIEEIYSRLTISNNYSREEFDEMISNAKWIVLLERDPLEWWAAETEYEMAKFEVIVEFGSVQNYKAEAMFGRCGAAIVFGMDVLELRG